VVHVDLYVDAALPQNQHHEPVHHQHSGMRLASGYEIPAEVCHQVGVVELCVFAQHRLDAGHYVEVHSLFHF